MKEDQLRRDGEGRTRPTEGKRVAVEFRMPCRDTAFSMLSDR